jgi:hypothetical protein
MNNAFKLIKLGCIYQLCYASGSSSVALDSMLISHLDKWFGVSLSKREVLGTHSLLAMTWVPFSLVPFSMVF